MNQNVESKLGIIKCLFDLEPSTAQVDTWILSPNPITATLIPFQIIRSHTENCVTANETAGYTVSVEPCKFDDTNQFWLFEQLSSDSVV